LETLVFAINLCHGWTVTSPPQTLTLSDVQYVLDSELVSVRCSDAAGLDCLWRDTEHQIAVIPYSAHTAAEAGPVYRAAASGAIAVPTGRLFVRVSEGMRARSFDSRFAKLRLCLDEAPDWAPNTVWLRHVDGDVAAALAAMTGLRTLPDVASVEPELLRSRSARDD